MITFPEFPVVQQVWSTLPSRRPSGKPKRQVMYQLRESFSAEFDLDGVRVLMIVPKGFKYDGGSIPRLGFTVSGLTPGGPIMPAATIHDFIWHHDGRMPRTTLLSWDEANQGWQDASFRIISRRESNEIFRDLMTRTIDPGSPTKAFRSSQVWLAFQAVEIGGRRW